MGLSERDGRGNGERDEQRLEEHGASAADADGDRDEEIDPTTRHEVTSGEDDREQAGGQEDRRFDDDSTFRPRRRSQGRTRRNR